jgi:hypothetical protein
MENGICQLCLQERLLCKSHIIPEFIYKPLYDQSDKNRFYSFRPSSDFVGIHQKGLWQHLFCESCERIFGAYEDYVAPIYKSGLWEHGEESRYTDGTICEGARLLKNLDYRIWKLLFLSIFWRLGISNKHFHRIELGSHQEAIRQMILTGDAGIETRYGISVARVTFKNEHVPALVGGFLTGRASPVTRIHGVILGGYSIDLWLGAEGIEAKFLPFLARENGTQLIPTLEFEKMEALHDLPDRIRSANKPF